MLELSISVEGVFGLTWPDWKRLVRTVEDLGFAGIYLSDHFLLTPPDPPAVELVVALTYLAGHTERVRFGPMVSPLSFRDPVMLARQAAALDDLSGGRMVLGVGTGWMEQEHAMFGYHLGDIPTRFARFEEGLEVITRLLRTDEPADFEGEFFRLQQALLPGPRRLGGPPIMIGGSGPKRTLPLVARFADVWNATRTGPEPLQERSALLDALLEAEGRHPEDVRRTLTAPILCGRTQAELESRLGRLRRFSVFRNLKVEQQVEQVRSVHGFIGTPEEVVAQVRPYKAAGISEIAVQWVDATDIEGLEVLATEVLPLLSSMSA